MRCGDKSLEEKAKKAAIEIRADQAKTRQLKKDERLRKIESQQMEIIKFESEKSSTHSEKRYLYPLISSGEILRYFQF